MFVFFVAFCLSGFFFSQPGGKKMYKSRLEPTLRLRSLSVKATWRRRQDTLVDEP